ncbi:NUDIX hydrolase [Rhodopirellula sp. MGV]|uniref:NUDIX hydrolase n=1 Tax=Rhodopirellula sp. MGV TaxID=2023130 RepID=UPI000B97547C|nr:CoA pyrophosphatase [Rhodopirellula sp. MGV]OYP36722.1 hypothetical protein CGZ80_07410 [Rhodopirellula sp. MGV]PNY34415.1 CoA pyrophosphatase [Rhodopirellula baltica]
MISLDASWRKSITRVLDDFAEPSYVRASQTFRALRQPTMPSRRRLSPRLAYGRHRGPARRGCRHAAVVIVIYPHRETGRPCIALTRRPMTLSHHAGQICLPGGRVENGEVAIEAAKREYHEELGVELDRATCLGTLPKIYVYASDNLVDTFVLVHQDHLPVWAPDPTEVDQVIEIPLSALSRLGRTAADSIVQIDSVRRGKVAEGDEVFNYGFSYPAIDLVDCEGRQHQVWGATAMLLAQWGEVLHRAQSGNG